MTDRCPECGIVYETITAPDAIVAIRSFPRRYRDAFGVLEDDEDPDALVRRRPDPGTWSALEYAAHVRGVVELFGERVHRALVEDRPVSPSVALDEHPWEGHEEGEPLDAVLGGLTEACDRMVASLETAKGDDWNRVVLRDGEELDVLWMARHTVHEGAHHLRDVEQVLRAVRSAG